MANSIGLVDGNVITASVPVAATAGQVLSSNGTTLAWTTPTTGTVTGLTGEVTTTGSGLLTVTLSNLAVISKTLSGLSVTSGAITSADSILTAMGKIQGQINGLAGGSTYKGTWNAATNTPTIVSSVGTGGDYYIVSVAGTTNINGTASWDVGDWIIFDGTVWQKVDNTDSVTSVNGFTGAVNLTTTNITEGTNLYYTDTRARSAISLTTTGSSGASTYISGALNIPNYTLAGLGGVPTTTTLSINGTSFDLSANRVWSVGTVTSVVGTGGYGGLTLSGTVTNTGSLTLGGTPTGTWPISIGGNAATVTIANTNVNTSYYIPLVSSTGNMSLLIDGGNDLNYNPFTNVFTIGGSIVINSVVINGGTANQFMKANGTLDNNIYLTGSGVSGRIAFWDSTYGLSSSAAMLFNSGTNNVTLTSLSGTGTRMVVADAAGVLSTQTIPVTSVFGRTGAVVAQSGDYTTTLVTEGTNLYYTDARARAAISLTTTGSSGSSTYIGGVINVPTYTLAGLGGVSTGTTITINGTTLDLSANRTWSVGTVTSVNATVPTGFSVGSPVTSSGDIAISYAAGYSLPTTAKQTQWDTAYNLTLGAALTKTDDTNVTITLGGTPATSVLRATSLTLGWTGQLSVARGGTGAATLTGVLIGNGASAVTAVTGTANQILRRNTAGTAYEFFTSGIISSTGTVNFVPLWSSSTSIGNSPLSFVSGEANFGSNKLVAGNVSATNGSIMLQDNYSNGHLSNIGSMYSGGNLMMGFCVTPSTSSSVSFVSSTAAEGFARSAIVAGTDVFFYTGVAQTVNVGSSVSMTENMRLYNNGNLVLQTGGSYVNGTQKLQVYGETLMKGTGSTVITTALTIQNDSNSTTFKVADSGDVYSGDGAWFRVQGASKRYIYKTDVTNEIFSVSSCSSLGTSINLFGATHATKPKTIQIAASYAPVSGTIAYNTLELSPNINQTGTANAIARGLYVNPVLNNTLSENNWRSVEWSNNGGYGLLGVGSAQNLLNGKLTVSPTVLAANFANANTISVLASQVLNIPIGNRGTIGSVYSAVTGAHYFRFNGVTTLFGDALWSGSANIANVQFDTAGTITMANSATGGYRPLSVMQLQMQASGANNGTIDHGATLFIQGVYPAGLTGVVTFTDYAAVRINDLKEWGGTSVVLTNRWGVYQAGADDKNYFAASVGIGVDAPVASAKLQVDSTTQGFLPPRMTLAQMNAIGTPAPGLIVFNTSDNKHYGYNGTTWTAFY